MGSRLYVCACVWWDAEEVCRRNPLPLSSLVLPLHAPSSVDGAVASFVDRRIMSFPHTHPLS